MPNTPALSLPEDPVSSFGQAHDSSSLRTEGSRDTGYSGADVDTADGADGIALLARQAIVDENREVYGYELFDRSSSTRTHTAASDAALLFHAMSSAAPETLVGHKTLFINCTHESLEGPHLELVHPDRVVLEIPTLG